MSGSVVTILLSRNPITFLMKSGSVQWLAQEHSLAKPGLEFRISQYPVQVFPPSEDTGSQERENEHNARATPGCWAAWWHSFASSAQREAQLQASGDAVREATAALQLGPRRKRNRTMWGTQLTKAPEWKQTFSTKHTIGEQPIFLTWKNETERFKTEKGSGPNFSLSSKFSRIFVSFLLLLACLVFECVYPWRPGPNLNRCPFFFSFFFVFS